MTESNTGEGTQDRIKELEAKLEEEKALRTKLEAMHDEDQKMIKRQSNEVGELRKATERIDKLEGELEELRSSRVEKVEGPKVEPKEEPKLEEIEKDVMAHPARKKAVEDAWEKMTPEERKQFAKDADFKKDIFQEALAIEDDSIPESPWTVAAGDDDNARSAKKKRIRELFKNEEKRSKGAPSGSEGGGNRPSPKDADEKPKATESTMSILGRPPRVR